MEIELIKLFIPFAFGVIVGIMIGTFFAKLKE